MRRHRVPRPRPRGAARLAAHRRAPGHRPPLSITDLASRYFRVAGHPGVTIRSLPRWVMHTAAPFVPMARELAEMDYQFYAPFILDSSAATDTFGLTASNLDESLRDVAAGAQRTAERKM